MPLPKLKETPSNQLDFFSLAGAEENILDESVEQTQATGLEEKESAAPFEKTDLEMIEELEKKEMSPDKKETLYKTIFGVLESLIEPQRQIEESAVPEIEKRHWHLFNVRAIEIFQKFWDWTPKKYKQNENYKNIIKQFEGILKTQGSQTEVLMFKYFQKVLDALDVLLPQGAEKIDDLTKKLDDFNKKNYQKTYDFQIKAVTLKPNGETDYFSVNPEDYLETKLLVGKPPESLLRGQCFKKANFGYVMQENLRRYGSMTVLCDKNNKIINVYLPSQDVKEYFLEQLNGREESEEQRIERISRQRKVRVRAIEFLSGKENEEEKQRVDADLNNKELVRRKLRTERLIPFGKSRLWDKLPGGSENFIDEIGAVYWSEQMLKDYGLTLEKVMLEDALAEIDRADLQNLSADEKKNLITHFIKQNNLTEFDKISSLKNLEQISDILRQRREDLVNIALLQKTTDDNGRLSYTAAHQEDVILIPYKNFYYNENGDLQEELVLARRRRLKPTIKYNNEKGEEIVIEVNGDLYLPENKYKHESLILSDKNKRELAALAYYAYLLIPRQWSEKEWQERWPKEEYNPQEARTAVYKRKLVISEGEFKTAVAYKMTNIDHLAVPGITMVDDELLKAVEAAGPSEVIVVFDADPDGKAQERGDLLTDSERASYRIACLLEELQVPVKVSFWPTESRIGKKVDIEDLLLDESVAKEVAIGLGIDIEKEQLEQLGKRIYLEEILDKAVSATDYAKMVNNSAKRESQGRYRRMEKLNFWTERLIGLFSNLRRNWRKYAIAKARGADAKFEPETEESIQTIRDFVRFFRDQATQYYLGVENLDRPASINKTLRPGEIPNQDKKCFVDADGGEWPIEGAQTSIIIHTFNENGEPDAIVVRKDDGEEAEYRLDDPSDATSIELPITYAKLKEALLLDDSSLRLDSASPQYDSDLNNIRADLLKGFKVLNTDMPLTDLRADAEQAMLVYLIGNYYLKNYDRETIIFKTNVKIIEKGRLLGFLPIAGFSAKESKRLVFCGFPPKLDAGRTEYKKSTEDEDIEKKLEQIKLTDKQLNDLQEMQDKLKQAKEKSARLSKEQKIFQKGTDKYNQRNKEKIQIDGEISALRAELKNKGVQNAQNKIEELEKQKKSLDKSFNEQVASLKVRKNKVSLEIFEVCAALRESKKESYRDIWRVIENYARENEIVELQGQTLNRGEYVKSILADLLKHWGIADDSLEEIELAKAAKEIIGDYHITAIFPDEIRGGLFDKLGKIGKIGTAAECGAGIWLNANRAPFSAPIPVPLLLFMNKWANNIRQVSGAAVWPPDKKQTEETPALTRVLGGRPERWVFPLYGIDGESRRAAENYFFNEGDLHKMESEKKQSLIICFSPEETLKEVGRQILNQQERIPIIGLNYSFDLLNNNKKIEEIIRKKPEKITISIGNLSDVRTVLNKFDAQGQKTGVYQEIYLLAKRIENLAGYSIPVALRKTDKKTGAVKMMEMPDIIEQIMSKFKDKAELKIDDIMNERQKQIVAFEQLVNYLSRPAKLPFETFKKYKDYQEAYKVGRKLSLKKLLPYKNERQRMKSILELKKALKSQESLFFAELFKQVSDRLTENKDIRKEFGKDKVETIDDLIRLKFLDPEMVLLTSKYDLEHIPGVLELDETKELQEMAERFALAV